VSRSEYIWLVLDSLDGSPLAAFTVRYECADWLFRYAEAEDVVVCRIKNSARYPKIKPVYLNPLTLDPIETRKEES